MRGNLRCVDGALMRHEPQSDDPDFEVDCGPCPECGGEGHDCHDCGAPHGRFVEGPTRALSIWLCEACAEARFDAAMDPYPDRAFPTAWND